MQGLKNAFNGATAAGWAVLMAGIVAYIGYCFLLDSYAEEERVRIRQANREAVLQVEANIAAMESDGELVAMSDDALLRGP